MYKHIQLGTKWFNIRVEVFIINDRFPWSMIIGVPITLFRFYISPCITIRECILKPYDLLWSEVTSTWLSIYIAWIGLVKVIAGNTKNTACVGIEMGLRFLSLTFLMGIDKTKENENARS